MADFWSNLTGGAVHTGSWGTPDIGVTEALANLVGRPSNNLVPDQAQRILAQSLGGGYAANQGLSNPQPTQYWPQADLNSRPPSTTGPDLSGGIRTNTNTNNSGQKPNPYTTYYGDTKLYDLINQGVRDEYGNLIQNKAPERKWNDQYGMYQDEVDARINDMFSGTSNYLNQAEQAVRGNLPGQLGEVTSAADLQKAKLGEGRQSTLDTIAANERGAQTRKEDALAAARRLYQELGQANVQRFGGSTSAGQAMSELQGREQQSQMGQTSRQFNEFMNQAAIQKASLDREYQTGLQTIEAEKSKAINSVNQAFQQSLLDIARDRATNESAKGQARLNALMDLRNKMFQISQQETQFKQSLEAQKQAAQLQIDTYLKTQGNIQQGINNAYNQFSTGTSITPQSKYAIQNMGVGTLQQPMYIGSIGKSIIGRNPDGSYQYSDGTSGPGGFLNQ